MIYTDNRQEKLNVNEEFINSLEAVCDFVLKKEGLAFLNYNSNIA